MTSRAKLYAIGEPLGDSCTRFDGGKRIYGGGGGGSSSSQSSSTTNVDKRQVVDTGSVGVSSDSSTVNVTNTSTDNGAFDSAVGFANDAGAGALDAYRMLLNTTVQLAGQHEQTIQASHDIAGQLSVSSSNTDDAEADKKKQFLTYAGIAVVVYLIAKKG